MVDDSSGIMSLPYDEKTAIIADGIATLIETDMPITVENLWYVAQYFGVTREEVEAYIAIA